MRDVTGILLLDKPAGRSSNSALQEVRRIYSAAKAGHTGSLDPLATGMLPICFGSATRLSGLLLDSDKRYRVEARIGTRTDTGDADGAEIESNDVRPDAETWRRAAAELVGEIRQIPPMYSAVHHQGRRLYELARQGIEVEREARVVHIRSLDVLDVSDQHFVLDVRCSKGTYVRVLVEDLAARVGALAHVSVLRRSSVSPFEDDAMVSMDAVLDAAEHGPEALDALLLPSARALSGWPVVTLDAARTFYMSRGQAVRVADAPVSGRVAVFGPGDALVAVAEVDEDGLVAPRKWLA
jgi:tRNA pseudouridine55 synthase